MPEWLLSAFEVAKSFFLLAIATNIVRPWSAVREFEADLTNIQTLGFIKLLTYSNKNSGPGSLKDG